MRRRDECDDSSFISVVQWRGGEQQPPTDYFRGMWDANRCLTAHRSILCILEQIALKINCHHITVRTRKVGAATHQHATVVLQTLPKVTFDVTSVLRCFAEKSDCKIEGPGEKGGQC